MNFLFIDEAISKLNTFASKDNKYKKNIADLINLLSKLEVDFLAFTSNHQKVLGETFKLQENTQKEHENKINDLNSNFNFFKDEIKNKIENLRRIKAESLVLIDNEISQNLEKLELELHDIKVVFQEKLNQNEIQKSKEKSYIEKQITEIRKDSSKSITQIEVNYANDLEKIESKFREYEFLFSNKIKDFENEILIEKIKIQETKNAYREQSDSKYLSVKNDYHQQSTAFNKKVDSIKKKRLDKQTKFTDQFNAATLPLESELLTIEENYKTVSKTLQEEFEEKVLEHKTKNDYIVNSYNERKQKIIKESSDAITLLNSKLSAYKEFIAKERLESQKEHNMKIRSLSEFEKDQLNKERNKFLRSQDNELNKQILKTQKDNLLKTKEQYELLAESEIRFIEEMAQWRIEEKVLALNFKLQNYNNYLNYQNKVKENETSLKKLKTTYDHQIHLLELNQLEMISPLESHLALDNATSERDVNLLSNDTNYHLNHYQYKEDLLEYKLQIFKLEQKETLDKEKIILQHEKNILSMTQQLSIEKETVIREQQLKNQELKLELLNDTAELNERLLEIEYLSKRAELETRISYLQKEKQTLHKFYDSDLNIDIDILKSDLAFEEERLVITENLEGINKDVEILNKDLNVIHSRINFLFNQIYLIYNIQHHLMIQLVKLYQLPAHPEDVKHFINLSADIFKELRIVQEQSKDDFLIDIKNFHEVKINDITGQKFTTAVSELQEELSSKLNDLEDDIKVIGQNTTKIEYQIQVLGNNVDKIQSNINQIELLKHQETNKRLIKNHQNEIDSLTRQINSIEIEMNALEKEIEKQNKPLDKIESQRKLLHQNFESSKKKLHHRQQVDAKVYFDQLAFYQNFMKKLTSLFNMYESKVLVLTNKLNQPLYLTDVMIRDAERVFSRLEDTFEKQSNAFYQDLIRQSIKVFEELNHEQESLKENYDKMLFKNMSLNKKEFESLKSLKSNQIMRHNQNLSNLKLEEETSIKTLQSNLNKDKQPRINELRALIKSLEDQIMNAEEKLKNELILIDANLQSALQQLHIEHQKNIEKNHETYLKLVNKSIESIDNKQKNLKQLEESTKAKNQLLINRFNQNDQKLKEQLKEKLSNLKEQISKSELAYQKKIEQLTDDLNLIYSKHNALINEETKKSKSLAADIEKTEKKNLINDISDAKKSYDFKIKTLNL